MYKFLHFNEHKPCSIIFLPYYRYCLVLSTSWPVSLQGAPQTSKAIWQVPLFPVLFVLVTHFSSVLHQQCWVLDRIGSVSIYNFSYWLKTVVVNLVHTCTDKLFVAVKMTGVNVRLMNSLTLQKVRKKNIF